MYAQIYTSIFKSVHTCTQYALGTTIHGHAHTLIDKVILMCTCMYAHVYISIQVCTQQLQIHNTVCKRVAFEHFQKKTNLSQPVCVVISSASFIIMRLIISLILFKKWVNLLEYKKMCNKPSSTVSQTLQSDFA